MFNADGSSNIIFSLNKIWSLERFLFRLLSPQSPGQYDLAGDLTDCNLKSNFHRAYEYHWHPFPVLLYRAKQLACPEGRRNAVCGELEVAHGVEGADPTLAKMEQKLVSGTISPLPHGPLFACCTMPRHTHLPLSSAPLGDMG